MRNRTGESGTQRNASAPPKTAIPGYGDRARLTRFADEIIAGNVQMEKILSSIPTVVVDHHLLRDEAWSKFLEPVRKTAEKAGNKLVTASELVDKKPDPLECKRQSLYEEEKVSEEFLEWAKLPEEKRGDKAPPLAT